MNAKEISRLVLYVVGGLLGLYLIYYGIAVERDAQTIAVGAALAGVDVLAALNIDGLKNRVPGDIPEPEGGDDVIAHGFSGDDELIADYGYDADDEIEDVITEEYTPKHG